MFENDKVVHAGAAWSGQADERVSAAASLGSAARGELDRWSDIDLALRQSPWDIGADDVPVQTNYRSIGTAAVAGDFALGAGWGASTVAVTSGSNAQRGEITITGTTDIENFLSAQLDREVTIESMRIARSRHATSPVASAAARNASKECIAALPPR